MGFHALKLTRQVLSKLLRLVGAVVAVSFLTFLLSHQIPGDPTAIILQSSVGDFFNCGEPYLGQPKLDCSPFSADQIYQRGETSPGAVAKVCEADQCVVAADVVRNMLHLDEPIVKQYLRWASSAVRGDLGLTFETTPAPVWPKISEALPSTLQLMLLAELFALVIAIPLGIYSAYRENSRGDRIITGASFLFIAIPNFVLAVFLIMIFVTTLDLVPSVYSGTDEGLWKSFSTLIIPAVALAAGMCAVYLRLLRSDMIATLQEDFILQARAKGLPPRRILLQHALRPSSFSLLTVFGINVGTLIGGTVIMEMMFSIPGIGTLLTTSIYKRNYPMIQAVVVVIATAYVAINVLVDILYSVLDPRIRNA